ncbi:alpha/beta hydrolase-fold protein [Polaribacter sp.]|uniref:alpha/beta hydrolase-fold protein n=1 Tax=Polaribacter sp. TaxID=1920175 RepID=UPI004047CC01
MKTIFITFALLLFSFCLKAQNDENIIIGKKEVITSKVLNENRTLWIYTPNITSQNPDPEKRYPVLYLLDGGAHFYSTVGIIQQHSQSNGNGTLPEMIIVAIENTNRVRDFIPSNDLDNPNPFIEFLSSELIPHIDKNYKTAPYKMLVGHSLGGLTVIDVLTNFPELFNAHIAIEPSMWYDNEKYLTNTITELPKQNMNGKRLFLGTANTLPKGMELSQLKNDKSIETQHIRSIFKLDEFLKTNTNGLIYGSKYYANETHNTIPLISEYDGLRFIFDFYLLDASEKDFTNATDLIATKLKTHYANVTKKMGYKNTAPESLINYFAYDALRKQHYNKAKALFELNIEWYPESNNVYDSYADYYLAQKDTANAVTYYQKALQIKNNTETQSKLNALTNKGTIKSATVDLQKYAGVYVLESYNISIVLEVRDNKLFAKVPGQKDDEFEFQSENIFTVKGKQGYKVTFEMDREIPIGFTSAQPNGTFKARFKNR